MTDATLESLFADMRGRMPAVSAAEAPLLYAGPEEMRFHGGRWWRRIEYGAAQPPYRVMMHGGSPFLHQTWQTLLHYAGPSGRVRPYGPATRATRDAPLALLPPELDPVAFEAALPGLRDKALASGLLVDGALHCMTEGPVVSVGLSRAGNAWVELLFASDLDLAGGLVAFDPSRWDEALGMARSISPDPSVHGRFEDLRPGAPPRDDAADAPAETVHDLLGACLAEGTPLIAPAALDAIAGLKALAEGPPFGAAEAQTAIEALLSAVSEPEDASHLPEAFRGTAEEARLRIRSVARFDLDRIAREARGSAEDMEALGDLAM